MKQTKSLLLLAALLILNIFAAPAQTVIGMGDDYDIDYLTPKTASKYPATRCRLP